eukprot:1116222-Prymnesium_polylepis.1
MVIAVRNPSDSSTRMFMARITSGLARRNPMSDSRPPIRTRLGLCVVLRTYRSGTRSAALPNRRLMACLNSLTLPAANTSESGLWSNTSNAALKVALYLIGQQ